MELSLILLEKIAGLFIVLLAGFLLVKLKAVDVKHSRVLSSLLLYALVPCSVIKAFQVDFTPQTAGNLGLAFLAAVIVQFGLLFLGIPLKKIFRLEPVEHTSVIYSNAGNIIIPLVSAALGEEWVIYTVAYLSVPLVVLWTHCRPSIT
ncbi:MAG: autotransporter, partial [Clostridiales bacterium]|nr:autotransporter [Clostridiales bacterium]